MRPDDFFCCIIICKRLHESSYFVKRQMFNSLAFPDRKKPLKITECFYRKRNLKEIIYRGKKLNL